MDQFHPQDSLQGKFKARYGLSPKAKVITYIGRLSSEKRPLIFVDVAKELVSKAPQEELVFVVAGDGQDLEPMKERIHYHGIKDKFILTGMIDKNQIRELLADTYLVLIVSEVEGLPLVMVEAMAMNVPVVSTDVGSVDEVITHGVNGFLVHPEKDVVEGFTSTIMTLLPSEEKYSAVSKETRRAVEEKFSLHIMAQQYTEELNRLSNGVK